MTDINIQIVIGLIAFIYFALGYPFTAWLCENWTWLKNKVRQHISIAAITYLLWWPIFVILVMIKLYEVLTVPRKKDWTDSFNYNEYD